MATERQARSATSHVPNLRPFLILFAVFLLIGGVLAVASANTGGAADPAGLHTGAATDLAGSVPDAPAPVTDAQGNVTSDPYATAATQEPFAAQLANVVNQNRLASNFIWTLVCGYLVMFMQAGFALVEVGFTRAKNALHTMMMNFGIYVLGMTGYFLTGFAFQEGGIGLVGVTNLGGLASLNQELTIHLGNVDWGIIGHKGFLLADGTYDVGVAVMFLFQMVFMDTTATIPTGAMAERWKWSAFCAYGFVIGGFIYPVFANWVWGGGWLSQLGHVGLGQGYIDFAGSGVVHAVGGWTALAGALIIGPRLGKFNKDGSANALPGHNLVLATVGTFILAFGWFGFNPGSTLGAAGFGNLRIGLIATVTMLASASGALSAMTYTWLTAKKPDPGMTLNGMLAGLVAITAPSGYVSPLNAFVIGAVAGVLVCFAVAFFERRVRVDDPVGAISVHGVNGLWGMIAVGLFADGTANYGGLSVRGLFYGDASQLAAQVVGAVVCFVWAFGVGWVFFKVYDRVAGLRVAPEVELAGLDIPEMGALPYTGDSTPGELAWPMPLPVLQPAGATV